MKMKRWKQVKNNGFTLIEVIISWLLVLLALLFVGDIIIFAVGATGTSRVRMEIAQKLEYYKNQLATKPFDTLGLENGTFSIIDGPFKITRCIAGLSPTLKRVTLSIRYKKLSKQIYFYKSKYIEEVDND